MASERISSTEDTLTNITCYFCKQKGHRRPDYPLLKKAKKIVLREQEQEANAAMAEEHMGLIGVSNSGTTIDEQDLEAEVMEEQMGLVSVPELVVAAARCKLLSEDDLVSDQGSTINMFCNKKIINNLPKAKTRSRSMESVAA